MNVASSGANLAMPDRLSYAAPPTRGGPRTPTGWQPVIGAAVAR